MGEVRWPRVFELRKAMILTLIALFLACLTTHAVGQSQASSLNSTGTSADLGFTNNGTQTVDPSLDGTDYANGNSTDYFDSGEEPTDDFSDVSGTDPDDWLKREWLNQDGNFTGDDGSGPWGSLPDYAEMDGGNNANWLGPGDDEFYEEQANMSDDELDTLLTPVAACQPSKLPGYNNSVDLNGKGLLLHWMHVSPQLMQMAVVAKPGSEAAAAGWISVGWSLEGHMVPADAIIGGAAVPPSGPQGDLPSVAPPGGLPAEKVLPFYITGYGVDSLERTNGLNFNEREWNWTRSKDGGVIMRFTRSAELDGFMPVQPQAINHMIWAFAPNASRQLAYHGRHKGSLRVDYSCATDADASSRAAVALYRSRLACKPSSLPGYSCMLQLQGDRFVLHWHLRNTSILLAADVATTGWIGVGWSKDGKMAGSAAAIGNLPRGTIKTGAAVGPYAMTGYNAADVAPSGQFELINDAVGTSSNGRTVMRFERGLLPGQMPFSNNLKATILWAYSRDNTQELAFHGDNMGSVTIDFSSGKASPSSSPALIAHAVFLSLAFFLLMPSAILIARLFLATPSSLSPTPLHLSDANSTDSHPSSSSSSSTMFPSSSSSHPDDSLSNDSRRLFWFTWHKYLQLAALVCICVGCITAFVSSGSQGFHYAHAWIGVFLLVLLVAIQPLVVFFRPSSRPSSSDSSDSAGQWHYASWTRGRWRVVHWLVGVVGVVFGWFNCFLGLTLYSKKFAAGVVGGYAVFGILAIIVGFLYGALIVRDVKRKKDANAAAAESTGFQMQSRAVP